MEETVKFTAALARLAGEGNDVVVSTLDENLAVIAARRCPGGTPDLSITFFDVSVNAAKAVVRDLRNDDIIFANPLPFVVSDEYQGNAKFNIAPALVALWQCGAGNVFDEMCFYCEDDQLGLAAIAIEAAVLAETGKTVELDHAYATRAELRDWAEKMSASDEPLMRQIGAQVDRALVHFINHDLEGNWIGAGGPAY